MSLQDKLEEIRHRRIDLRDHDDTDPHSNPHRPDLSVWASHEAETGNHVVLTLASLWGQPQRFVEMNPAEARRLAHALNAMAASVEHAMHDVPTSRAQLMQQFRDCPENAERAP